MFTSLRSRLWLSYALVITLALSIVAIVLLAFLVQNPVLSRQTQTQLETIKNRILESPQRYIKRPELLDEISTLTNVRVVLFNASREVVADTNPDQTQLPFPRRTLMNRDFQSIRAEDGTAWLYSFSRLQNGQVLVVAAPRPRVSVLNVFADQFFIPILEAGVIAMLASFVLAFALSRWVADPLQKVVQAAHVYPEENIKTIVVHGPREVQDLTRAFNSMIERVRKSQQSQKDFVANVSHELKTPLTSIQGFSQAILDDTASTPEARTQAAQIIHNESSRMHRMVVDLLDLARLDAGTAEIKMSDVDMVSLLLNIGKKFELLAKEKKIQLQVSLPNDLNLIKGDGDRLSQVFTNLVDNAMKFTPVNGAINISAREDKAWIHVSVADTGPGVPNEALPHLFDRFYQVDPSRAGGESHGAGLGLAIVKEIVDAHGGKIGVRNQQGGGAEFFIQLPLA